MPRSPIRPRPAEGPPLPPVRVRLRDHRDDVQDITIESLTHRTTAEELAAAIGRGGPLVVDGLVVAPSERVINHLVTGSTISSTPEIPADDEFERPRLTWIAGPDSGRIHRLAPGVSVVGRSSHADIDIDDETASAHHAQLLRHADGRVQILDLGVGAPVRLDDSPVSSAALVNPGAWIQVGASVAEFTRQPAPLPAPRPAPSHSAANRRTGWHVPLIRSAIVQPPVATAPIPLPARQPAPTPSSTGLLAIAITVIGGAVLALAMGQPVMLLMVAFGALAGGVGAAGGWRRQRRDRRDHAVSEAQKREQFAAAVEAQFRLADSQIRQRAMTVGRAAEAAESARGLWEQRSTGTLTTCLGVGDQPWAPTLEGSVDALHTASWTVASEHSVLRRAPIELPLAPGSVLGIAGPRSQCLAAVRGLITSLAAAYGPADWRIAVWADDPANTSEWAWTDWLPHAVDDTAVSRTPAEFDDTLRRHADGGFRLVTILDGGEQLTTRTTALRRALCTTGTTVGAIVIADTVRDLPPVCSHVVDVAHDCTATVETLGGSVASRCRVSGVTAGRAAELAARLSRFVDPEASQPTIPAAVDLTDLLPVGESSTDIAAHWAASGDDPAPRAVIGLGADGPVYIDLVKDGPHALLVGTTGAGKSETLRSWVLSLAAGSPPEHLNFVLIDYKGGSAFDSCAQLPHVVGVVTDLDDQLAERVLISLESELKRRERLLRLAGAADLSEYRAAISDDSVVLEPLPRLVVAIDEFAALTAELPDFVTTLVGIAQRGRSLGIHLILATQRPAAVSDDIRANTNLRVALRLHDPGDSLDVIGSPRAAQLPRSRPGRAVIRLGADETIEFQSPRCTAAIAPRTSQVVIRERHGDSGAQSDRDTHATPRSIDVVAVAIVAAHESRSLPAPRRPWLEPLPAQLEQSPETWSHGVVGLIDAPARQQQQALRWEPSSGHLVVCGVLGSGTSTALVSAAFALVASRAPSACHLYGLDATGAGELDELGVFPHCAGVVNAADLETRRRLLRRLTTLIAERSLSNSRSAAVTVLFIDGFAGLRLELMNAHDHDEFDALEHIIADGPSVGVVIACATDQPSALPLTLLARCEARWVMRLADPVDATALGVPPGRALAASAAPGRGVLGGGSSDAGLHFQVAIPPTGPVALTSPDPGSGPVVLRPLPSKIPYTALEPGSVHCEHGLELAIGWNVGDDATALLRLFPGEHALISGPARSGRTDFLISCALQWQRASTMPERVFVVSPRSESRFRSFGFEAVSVAELLAEAAKHEVVGAVEPRPTLVVLDDAESIEDPDGCLQLLLARPPAGWHALTAGRGDRLREQYDHWSVAVRRSRVVVFLGPINELDSDLAGARLPRHTVSKRRTHRGLLFSEGEAKELLTVSVVTS